MASDNNDSNLISAEQMDTVIKAIISSPNEAPLSAEQIAAIYDILDDKNKQSNQIEGESGLSKQINEKNIEVRDAEAPMPTIEPDLSPGMSDQENHTKRRFDLDNAIPMAIRHY